MYRVYFMDHGDFEYTHYGDFEQRYHAESAVVLLSQSHNYAWIEEINEEDLY